MYKVRYIHLRCDTPQHNMRTERWVLPLYILFIYSIIIVTAQVDIFISLAPQYYCTCTKGKSSKLMCVEQAKFNLPKIGPIPSALCAPGLSGTKPSHCWDQCQAPAIISITSVQVGIDPITTSYLIHRKVHHITILSSIIPILFQMHKVFIEGDLKAIN